LNRREQKAQRPERWEEVKGMYLRRELNGHEAAERLGISPAWFFRLLHRDDPARRSLKREQGLKLKELNTRYTTLLQKTFSDYEICMMIRARDRCGRCPLNCNGSMRYKGLGRKLTERVLIDEDGRPSQKALKADGKPLEDA
jgi:hypothetical protein